MHEDLLEETETRMEEARTHDLIIDFHVTACGDDLELIMTHPQGVDNEIIHHLAWETFEVRHLSNTVANSLRRHGPFEPHRLPMEEMEYTTLPQVMEKLEGRWEKLQEQVRR
jgi:fructose 1,6-bisphosphatase